MANTFKSFGTQNVGTTKVSVYTVPAATSATVIGLSLANILTTTEVALVDVKVSKSGVETFLIRNAPIAPGGSLIVIGGEQKVVLQTTDILKIQSSVAASIDVFTSLLEIT